MKTKIVQIGTSFGIRIPKALLEKSGLKGEVVVDARKHQIVIRPSKKVRQGWEESFKRMAKSGDDRLLDSEEVLSRQSNWDEDEWTW